MKYDPNSKIRSQREDMQAFQLRLPKEQIRDLQVLRLLAGVKVSAELRGLVSAYLDAKRPMLAKAIQRMGESITLENEEQVEAAESLHASGLVSHEGDIEKPE